MNWREARELRGLTQEDVMYLWRSSNIPDVIKKDISTGKYTRLDANDPRKPKSGIGPLAKYELARLLDVDLSEVDVEAAEDHAAIVAAVGGQGKRSPTWKNATRRAASVAA